MTAKEAKEKFIEIAENNNSVNFYGYMYGYAEPDEKILDMTVSLDSISKQGDSFFYIWGYPGPDYNEYRFEDYGITWAFEMKDFMEVKNDN